jgi:hypothetical protein
VKNLNLEGNVIPSELTQKIKNALLVNLNRYAKQANKQLTVQKKQLEKTLKGQDI